MEPTTLKRAFPQTQLWKLLIRITKKVFDKLC